MHLWNINQPTTTRYFHLSLENPSHLTRKYLASHLRKQHISRALGMSVYFLVNVKKLWNFPKTGHNAFKICVKIQTANYIPTKQDAEESFWFFFVRILVFCFFSEFCFRTFTMCLMFFFYEFCFRICFSRFFHFFLLILFRTSFSELYFLIHPK